MILPRSSAWRLRWRRYDPAQLTISRNGTKSGARRRAAFTSGRRPDVHAEADVEVHRDQDAEHGCLR